MDTKIRIQPASADATWQKASRVFLMALLAVSLVGGSFADEGAPFANDLGALHPPSVGGTATEGYADDAGEDHPVDVERDASRNEVSVAAHPSKPKIVIAAMHDYAEGPSQGPAVVTYRSVDGGESYERTGVFPPPVSEVWTADPSVAFDSRGRAYVSFLQGVAQQDDGTYKGGGLYVARSPDGGKTWAAPRLAVRSVDQGRCAGPDKPYIGIGPSRRGGKDVIYVSWQEHQSTDPQACEDFDGGIIVKVARSTDGARSFSEPVALSQLEEHAFGSMPRVAPDGALYVSFRVGGSDAGCERDPNFSIRMVVEISRDEGRSFDRSVVKDTCSVSGVSNGVVLGANSIPILDISTDGDLAMVWAAGETEADNQVEAVVSSDGGKRWRDLPALAVGPEVAALQEWLAYGPDERLHVMYVAAAPSGSYDAYLASSTKDGSWSEPRKLTSAPSLGSGVYAGFGLGHYPGFDVGVDNVGYGMWSDARGLPAMYTQDVWTRSVQL